MIKRLDGNVGLTEASCFQHETVTAVKSPIRTTHHRPSYRPTDTQLDRCRSMSHHLLSFTLLLFDPLYISYDNRDEYSSIISNISSSLSSSLSVCPVSSDFDHNIASTLPCSPATPLPRYLLNITVQLQNRTVCISL